MNWNASVTSGPSVSPYSLPIHMLINEDSISHVWILMRGLCHHIAQYLNKIATFAEKVLANL